LLVREGFAVPVSKCLWRLTEKGLKHVRS
jgi:hypothetical protein